MKHLTTILAAVLCAVCLSGCDGDKTQEQIVILSMEDLTKKEYEMLKGGSHGED